MASSHLRFGVLFLPGFQLLDAFGPMDYLNNHTKEVFELAKSPLAAKAPTMEWHFISYTPDLTPIKASSGPLLPPTCTYADCPPLDYLIVPGNDPAAPLPAGCTEFLKRKLTEVKLLLTVCTGSMAIAQSGVLDGLQVCSNKMALKIFSELGALRKEVKWVGDRRWIKDGKVWSAGGVTAGIDLAAEFARVYFDHELVEYAKLINEYAPIPDKPDVFSKILEGVKL